MLKEIELKVLKEIVSNLKYDNWDNYTIERWAADIKIKAAEKCNDCCLVKEDGNVKVYNVEVEAAPHYHSQNGYAVFAIVEIIETMTDDEIYSTESIIIDWSF